jgi:membrane-bound lytic murein transglycosylase D
MTLISIMTFVLMGVMTIALPKAAVLDPMPRPPSLEPAVQFWTDVFARWEEDHIVFFDEFDMARVYEVRRLPPSNGTSSREREREHLRARWKESLIEDLEALAKPDADYDSLQGRQSRLYGILDECRDPEVYRQAAEDVRSQRGIRDAFMEGVSHSARYVDTFKHIFREEGVPEELVYLPHVESSYRWNARSSVGAVGMWQFMAYTARKYMIVDHAVDERLDPFTAARAAARYLKIAYEELGSWPLAITSYNHGVDGIRNAIRETGTQDISAIIGEYRGPLFGFAGRNFYPEFLAAVDIAESLLADPGDLQLDEPASFDSFDLPAYVKIQTVAVAFDVSQEDLVSLNPSMRRSARNGDLYLSKGMNLKLPSGAVTNPEVLFASIPKAKRPTKRPQHTYRVKRGDTMGAIARKHKTTVRTLQRLNGIRNPNRLRAGTVLKLPH